VNSEFGSSESDVVRALLACHLGALSLLHFLRGSHLTENEMNAIRSHRQPLRSNERYIETP
jgi:hypothetical protein